MLEKLAGDVRDMIRRRHKSKLIAANGCAVQWAVMLVRAERGGENVEIDTDLLLADLEAAGLTMDDFEAMLGLARRRFDWSDVAAKKPALKVSMERLAAEVREFDEAEAARHREALKTLADMQEAARREEHAYLEAFEAQQQLKGTSAPPLDSEVLTAELKDVTSRIRATELKLNPAGQPGHSGALWGGLYTAPAQLAAQTRRALDEPHAEFGPERRAQLESQLEAAEAAVDDAQRDLASLKRRHAALTAKLTAPPANLLDPANMPIVRVRKPQGAPA